MNRFVFAAVFAAGLFALAWVGAGFVGSSSLALLMTAVIASVYGLGALELHRFRAATQALARALAPDAAPTTAGDAALGSDLTPWLQQVPASLRPAVRLRLEGERSPLPAPALTPYLVGLLVMLGMLGTFLGMIVTFQGTVFALEGSADLQAIRSALAAPIKGLGLSFGTSVAGVAASAALGLLSALSRRERLEVSRQLDQYIASVLRPWSLPHQRQETFKSLQAQSQALPQVAQQLQQLIDGLEQRNQQQQNQLQARQDEFHRQAAEAYKTLAESVSQALQSSLSASAKAASDSLLPAVRSALDGLASQVQQLHEQQLALTRTQLQEWTSGFSATADRLASGWTDALGTQQRSTEALLKQLQESHAQGMQRQEQTGAAWMDRLDTSSQALLQGFTHAQTRTSAAFEEHAQHLAERLQSLLEQSQARLAQADADRLTAWSGQLQTTAQTLQAAWQQAGERTLQQQQAATEQLQAACADIAARTGEQAQHTLAAMQQALQQSQALLASSAHSEAQWSQKQQDRTEHIAQLWRTGLSALRDEESMRHQAAVERWEALQDSLSQHLLAVQQALQQTQDQLAQAEQQRMAVWSAQQQTAFDAVLQQWQRTAQQTLQQQQAVCHALEQATGHIAERVGQQASGALKDMQRLLDTSDSLMRQRQATEAQWSAEQTARMDQLAQLWRTELAALREQEARHGQAAVEQLSMLQSAHADHIAALGASLEAPMTQVLQTASAVPQAAAQVIVQLREESTRLTERDNQALQERATVLQQIADLVQSLQQAAHAQQTAVQALVDSTGQTLHQSSEQVLQTLQQQASHAADIATQVQGSAIELSSLGESFQLGVQQFTISSDKLLDSLQRIESALEQSMARSDDQLAYYVGQAREVIDLSISSQQRIVEDLQRLGSAHTVATGVQAG